MTTEEYFAHLKVHGSQSDRLLSNMLRRVPSGAAVEVKFFFTSLNNNHY